jgi:hypothetical protein
MRTLLRLAVVLALTPAAPAADLERELAGRLRGAWVVLEVPVRSDCSGAYTDNKVSGARAVGSGAHALPAGELGQIDKVDLHRARIDLKVTLAEPLRVSWQDGPFTLHRHAACRVELEADLPREVVARGDAVAVERALAQALERHDAREAAEASRGWNAREAEPFPDDYDATLAEHARWKAEQANAAVRARLDDADAEASRVADRLVSDPEYVAGFAQGVERARALRWPDCGGLVSGGVEALVSRPSHAGNRTDAERRRDRGFEDGQRLVVALELRRLLPACFVSPEAR